MGGDTFLGTVAEQNIGFEHYLFAGSYELRDASEEVHAGFDSLAYLLLVVAIATNQSNGRFRYFFPPAV
jgi:hypothetical protein